MKSYNKVVAGALAAALMMSAVSCSKKTTETQDTSASDATTITISSDVPVSESSSVPSVQATNENGEFVIDGETFEERYGSQLHSYLNHQYYFDGKPVPVTEWNYYMIHEFVEFNKMAQQNNADLPLTSEGLVDLSHEFANGIEYEGYDFNNVGDMVKFYAEVSVACSYICLDLGEEYGIELSQETKDSVEEQIAAVNDLAVTANLTLDQFLSVNYGPGFDETAFREILLNYYYFDDFIANYPLDEDMKYAPKVVHALFEARSGIATEEEMAEAKKQADEFLASCTSTDDIETKGVELYNQGVVAECASYTVIKDRFVSEFEDWAYDESRQEGDMEVVKTDYGYHVMGYLGLMPIPENELLTLQSNLASEEIYSVYYTGVHEFYTKDEYEAPKPVAGDPTSASETGPSESLPLDENGNIIVETKATEEPALKMGADKTSTGLTATRIVAASVAGVAIIAIIGLIIATVVKGDKNKNEDDESENKEKNSGKGKKVREEASEEESEEELTED